MKKGSEKTDTDSGVVNSDACGKNASGKITVSKFARSAEKMIQSTSYSGTLFFSNYNGRSLSMMRVWNGGKGK